MIVTVSLPEPEWRSLLELAPKCSDRCGGIAEVAVDGVQLCCRCAGQRRTGRCFGLPWSEAAIAIEDALSPHVPSGKWEMGT